MLPPDHYHMVRSTLRTSWHCYPSFSLVLPYMFNEDNESLKFIVIHVQ